MAPSDPEIDIPALGSVLVTGGCGFLGSHIVSLLLASKTPQRVSVIDLRISPQSTFPGAAYHSVDITNADAITDILQEVKPDVIIHTVSPVFGSAAGSAARRKQEEIMNQINVEGTRTLMELSRELGTSVFIYTSSASVIGDQVHDLINADERWSYVRGKAQKEYYSDTKVIVPPGCIQNVY